MNSTIPSFVQKYFWGDDLSQLNWMDHQRYITETLLEKGDAASVTWLLQQEDKKEISKLLPSLKLSEKSANYWKMYFS